jgi:sugar O-acyltransferase (sialic acid O-acetyltransferase NeuD family)
MIRAVGLGAGGHCRVLLDALALMGGVEVVGLTDETLAPGTSVAGAPVLGKDIWLGSAHTERVTHAFVAVGSTGDASVRERLFASILHHGLQPLTIVHPDATISPQSELGQGVCVLARAVVNAAARIGPNVIINTGAVVEHDCLVGGHTHVAPGALLAAGVRVGAGAHIGLGAVILQGRTLGDRCVVGAGAVVTRDVEPASVVYGAPARRIRTVQTGADQHAD